MMRKGRNLVGAHLFSSAMRPTFYRQFVGGDCKEELTTTADKLALANIRLMVCPVQEEDVGEQELQDQDAE